MINKLITFPVPGGPNNKTPFHGSNIPVKNYGYFNGINTASFNNLLASFNPTISLNITPGLLIHISLK